MGLEGRQVRNGVVLRLSQEKFVEEEAEINAVLFKRLNKRINDTSWARPRPSRRTLRL